MIRAVLIALLCVVCTSAYACDAMRPCYANGKPLYDSAVAQDSFSGRRAVRHRARRETRRRVPEGLARVMAEGAGRAAGIVRSATGATAHVASRATGAFQCLVSALDRQGYPIRFMGGWRRHGSVRASLHPAGLALDINQYRRNVTKPRMPHNEISLANACGLISGAQWANGDSGHFQLADGRGGMSHIVGIIIGTTRARHDPVARLDRPHCSLTAHHRHGEGEGRGYDTLSRHPRHTSNGPQQQSQDDRRAGR